MGYANLRKCLDDLEAAGQLVRIEQEGDADLEVAEEDETGDDETDYYRGQYAAPAPGTSALPTRRWPSRKGLSRAKITSFAWESPFLKVGRCLIWKLTIPILNWNASNFGGMKRHDYNRESLLKISGARRLGL